MRLSLALLCLCSLLVLGTAPAQTTGDIGSEVTFELRNGDTVRGTLVEVRVDSFVVDHVFLGRVVVPRTAIKPPEPPPDEIEPESPWSGSFDVAVDGSRGNTKNQNVHAGLTLRRKTDETIDKYDVSFQWKRNETEVPDPGNPPNNKKTSDTTADRLFVQARREWLPEDSDWRPFLQGTVERDLFKEYDERVAVHTGAGHPIIDTEDETLTGRLGVGGSREFGGDDGSWKPEALLGLDYILDLAETQRLEAAIDVFPDLKDSGEYRTVSRVNWSMDLDAESIWYLKAGIEHFYDSTPNGDGPVVGPSPRRTPADYNYFVGIGRSF